MTDRVIIFLSSILFVSASLFAQRNYGQELVNLLNEGKCFEARDFKKQYKDSMPKNPTVNAFVALYYNYKMTSFLNKPDSSAIYLHRLVTDYESILGPSKSHFYGEMCNIYFDQQQFDKGIVLCDEIIAYLKRNPFHIEDKAYQDSEIKETEKIKTSFAEWGKNEVMRKLVRIKSHNNQRIPLYNDSTFIFFDAEYNGHRVKTWFDTGVSYYLVIEKKLADRIGVKFKPSKDSLQLMNNTNVRAIEGVIDSVALGNVRLHNIPVMVFLNEFTAMIKDSLISLPEKKAIVDSAFNCPQIILGLPTMRLIGQFNFEWKNRSLLLPEKSNTQKVEPNIYLEGTDLCTDLIINKLKYRGTIDTGSSCFINIDSAFYAKNKNAIRIDTITRKEPLNYAMATGIYRNIPYELLAQDMNISFNEKVVARYPKDVAILKAGYSKTPTGLIGVYFLRRIGSKTLFDFRNMRIEGKGKPIKKKESTSSQE